MVLLKFNFGEREKLVVDANQIWPHAAFFFFEEEEEKESANTTTERHPF
jgi:hypothetical protein